MYDQYLVANRFSGDVSNVLFRMLHYLLTEIEKLTVPTPAVVEESNVEMQDRADLTNLSEWRSSLASIGRIQHLASWLESIAYIWTLNSARLRSQSFNQSRSSDTRSDVLTPCLSILQFSHRDFGPSRCYQEYNEASARLNSNYTGPSNPSTVGIDPSSRVSMNRSRDFQISLNELPRNQRESVHHAAFTNEDVNCHAEIGEPLFARSPELHDVVSLFVCSTADKDVQRFALCQLDRGWYLPYRLLLDQVFQDTKTPLQLPFNKYEAIMFTAKELLQDLLDPLALPSARIHGVMHIWHKLMPYGRSAAETGKHFLFRSLLELAIQAMSSNPFLSF